MTIKPLPAKARRGADPGTPSYWEQRATSRENRALRLQRNTVIAQREARLFYRVAEQARREGRYIMPEEVDAMWVAEIAAHPVRPFHGEAA